MRNDTLLLFNLRVKKYYVIVGQYQTTKINTSRNNHRNQFKQLLVRSLPSPFITRKGCRDSYIYRFICLFQKDYLGPKWATKASLHFRACCLEYNKKCNFAHLVSSNVRKPTRSPYVENVFSLINVRFVFKLSLGSQTQKTF